MAIRAVVVDDDASNRALLRMVFESDPRVDLIGEAEDGLAAIKLANLEHPDVIILDINMPLMDGLSVIPEILDISPESKILVFSSADEGYREQVIELGAHDFVQKGIDVGDLSERIIDLTAATSS
ncbi:MAG: two-component system, chemotaxis family, protein-glutamate methylesterase/glutaminase [Actinomycetota bacterium]|jgi:DNA-binding NarL/FixJ family response regulator|nr:two-component system, chemotaxis family, protein-glutamate methylesterase/glutaminase [Actinomycetota bacterium]